MTIETSFTSLNVLTKRENMLVGEKKENNVFFLKKVKMNNCVNERMKTRKIIAKKGEQRGLRNKHYKK